VSRQQTEINQARVCTVCTYLHLTSILFYSILSKAIGIHQGGTYYGI